MDKHKKNCFIICPIGEEESPIRKRSDDIYKHIIQPVVSEFNYNLDRADKIQKSGIISKQIIQHLLNDDLVIADLSTYNPNVFYELAIRHFIRKPYIQMIEKEEKIPFDINTIRTIQLDYNDWDTIEKCKSELKDYILEIEKDPSNVDSPISESINWQEINKSENSTDKLLSQIVSSMETLSREVESLKPTVNPLYNILKSTTRGLTPSEMPQEPFNSSKGLGAALVEAQNKRWIPIEQLLE